MRADNDMRYASIQHDVVSVQSCSLTETHPSVADKSQQPTHLIISLLTGLLQDYQFVLRNRLPVLAVIPVRHIGLGKGVAALNAMLPHHKIDDGPHRPKDALHTAKRQPFVEQMVTEGSCIRG